MSPPPPSSSAAPAALALPAPAPRIVRLAGGVRERVQADGAVTLSWRSSTAMVSGGAICGVSLACCAAVFPHPIAFWMVPLVLAGAALAALSSSIRVTDGRLTSRWGPNAAFLVDEIAITDVEALCVQAGGDGACDVVATLRDGAKRVLAAQVSRDAADAIAAALERHLTGARVAARPASR